MKRARLLFIDDEEINRNNFQQTFADEYEILPAASGKEALEIMAREDDLALILSDQPMPVLYFRCVRCTAPVVVNGNWSLA